MLIFHFPPSTGSHIWCHEQEQVLLTTHACVSGNSHPVQTLWCLHLSDAVRVGGARATDSEQKPRQNPIKINSITNFIFWFNLYKGHERLLAFHSLSSINQCVWKPAVTFDTQLLLHFNCWCVCPLWRCSYELSLLLELNGLADGSRYWEESAGMEASLAIMFHIRYVTSYEQRVKPTGGNIRQNYSTISSPTFHPLVHRRLSSYFRTSQMTITAVSFIIRCLLFSSLK